MNKSLKLTDKTNLVKTPSTINGKSFLIEGIMFLTYAFFAVSWIAGTTLTPQIMAYYNLESFSSATLMSNAITVAKIIGNLCAAWLLVKLNPKKAIAFASFLIAAGAGLAPLVTEYWMFIALRFVMGFGGALFIVYFGPIVIRYFEREHLPIVNGINAVAYNVGSIIAMIIVIPVSTWLSTWQNSMYLFAGVSVLLLILWLIFGEDFDLNKATNSETDKGKNVYSFKDGLRDKFNYIYPFTYSGLLLLYIVILTIFPIADFTAINAKVLSSTFAVSAIAGSVSGIVLTKKTDRRLPILRWAGLFMTLSALIMVMTNSATLSIVMAAITGFLMFLPMTALTLIPQELPNMTPSKLTIMMGFFWSFSYIIESIAYYFVGVLIDYSGFQAGLFLAILISLTFFAGSFILPETGKKNFAK